METLEQRLRREAVDYSFRKDYQNYDGKKLNYFFHEEDLYTLISHTISETLKEAVRVIEDRKIPVTIENRVESAFGSLIDDRYNEALSSAITAVEGLATKTDKQD